MRVAEEPEIDLALIVVDEQEADVGNVREGPGLLRLRFRGGAGDELGAAAVRHPDARLGTGRRRSIARGCIRSDR